MIEDAHFDSIIDFAYLPFSQYLASASADGTIKIWDPIGRPYNLSSNSKFSTIPLKPGYYIQGSGQRSISNYPFTEVRRILTHENTCFKMCPLVNVLN